MSSPQLVGMKDNTAIGSWNNLCIQVYRGKPTVLASREMAKLYRSKIQQYPSGIAAVVIVEDGVPLPEDDVRREVAGIMREISPHMLGMCGVLEASGFTGAAVRSVVTAMTMMSRAPYKTSTVSTVQAASGWLARYISPNVSSSQVESAINQFRKLADEAQGWSKQRAAP